MSNLNPVKPVTTNAAGDPTPVPQPKVIAGATAGAITILVVFVVQSIWPDFEIPPAVASAFTTLISFAAAYFKRPSGVS
jgi:hypothetical protein